MKHLLLILTCFITLQSFSQTKFLKDVSSTKEMSLEITMLFKQNKINDAFEKLTPYWPIPENEIETLKEKIISVEEELDKTIDSIKMVTDLVVKEAFNVFCENGIKATR